MLRTALEKELMERKKVLEEDLKDHKKRLDHLERQVLMYRLDRSTREQKKNESNQGKK